MPELPEVETTKRGLSPYVKDQAIVDVKINQYRLRWPIPKTINKSLINQHILDLKRRAKYLIFELEEGTMIAHLGMSGHFKIKALNEPWEKHDHFGFRVKDKWLCLNDPRRFGAILYTHEDWHQHPLIKSLGIEPLSTGFTAQYLFDQCQRRSIPIKTAIMTSSIVVGVGNIYASESLFEAGIHPKKTANTVTHEQCQALVKAIKKILKLAIKSGGTTLKDFRTVKGKLGFFEQKLKVYGKENQPCSECGHPIEKITLGQRSTFYCPICQS